jgi:RNA polymerase sigma factor for flagellar operon FliA
MYSALATGTTAEERERLILDHIWLVQVIAARIHERLPMHVAFEDLVSAGTLGLISAIDNFDPTRNVQLKTYSEHKIRGAILDSLRDLDWVPRSARKTAKEIASAISAARQRWGREPGAEEIAAEMKMSLEEYHELLAQTRSVEPLPLESASPEEGGVDLLRLLPDSEDNQPSRLVERAELESLLTEAIKRMPSIERTVLSMYYREELSLKEIAQVLDVHFSRVSQLKAQAVLRLRAYIDKRTTPPLPRPPGNGVARMAT